MRGHSCARLSTSDWCQAEEVGAEQAGIRVKPRVGKFLSLTLFRAWGRAGREWMEMRCCVL